MKAINKTRQIIISENVIIPKSFLEQSLGLLKYKTPVAMLLKTHFGIHTFGMSYSIDVLILDEENRVVAVKKKLIPNGIFLWNFKYNTVLELPKGTINKSKTQQFDTLIFIEE